MATNTISLFYILLFIFVATNQVASLKCYTCTVNSGDADQRCVTNPSAVESGQNIVNCNKEYCTSKRVEYKDPPNKVHSMHRGCESEPEQMNTIVEDDTFITFYKACKKNLCNKGSGKGSGDGDVGFDPETGAEEIIKTEGINYAPRSAQISITVVGAISVLHFIMKLLTNEN